MEIDGQGVGVATHYHKAYEWHLLYSSMSITVSLSVMHPDGLKGSFVIHGFFTKQRPVY